MKMQREVRMRTIVRRMIAEQPFESYIDHGFDFILLKYPTTISVVTYQAKLDAPSME